MFSGYLPSDNFPGKEIDDDAKIVPLTSYTNVCGVACPNAVRFIWIEFLLKMSLTLSIGTGVAELRFTR